MGGLLALASGDGHGVTLVATAAGLAAIGTEPEHTHTSPAGERDAATEEPALDAATKVEAPHRSRTSREGTKQATLIAMLRAPDGATTRGDHGRDGLAVTHSARGDGGGAEEEARAYRLL